MERHSLRPAMPSLGARVKSNSDAPNSIAKVCAVLRILRSDTAMRLREVTTETGLNKVTVLRILENLAREGFAERSGRGFVSGPEQVVIGAAMGRADGLCERARPSLVRLASGAEDTALLCVRSGLEAVCIDRQPGTFPVQAEWLDVGSRRPLGIDAGGLALLAWQTDAEIDAMLEASHGRAGGASSEALIRDGVADARRRGHVVVLDGAAPNMGTIAVRLCDPAGRTIAALSIAALSERIARREAALAQALWREVEWLDARRTASAARAAAARLGAGTGEGS